MATFPPDYAARVYAGVLGKIIGVYLGRPFEQWSHERIVERFGEIAYYVHGKQGVPLIVADDDISGTFTFVRALEDHGWDPAITPAQIGRTWLNYIIENRSILWWGGLGNSTEHTAYLRLKSGIAAPASGSAAVNTRAVAEEIGAQIFIDGWAMVAPGDPERAADLARRAASVSHDGEAIHGAQVVAALESLAFVERDLGRMLDTALGLIPRDSDIFRMAAELRERHAGEPDWRVTLAWLRATWGYERYRTNCPMVSNHAVVLLGLLYGGDDFQRALLVTNTAGYDTDCNSGNVGCFLGIKNGLAGIEAPGQPDWRGPVADRMVVPTADGGRGVTDALTEAYHLINTARRCAGLAPEVPKDGAQFHFTLPGSVQGWMAAPDTVAPVRVAHVGGQVEVRLGAAGVGRAEAPTFLHPDQLGGGAYALVASPTVWTGQQMTVRLVAPASQGGPVTARLGMRRYVRHADTVWVAGPSVVLAPGAVVNLAWEVPDTGGHPVCAVGVEVEGAAGAAVCVERWGWAGVPRVVLGVPADAGEGGGVGRPAWQRVWVDAVDHNHPGWAGAHHIVQNRGRGLIATGTAQWTDYAVTATVNPRVFVAGGLVARYGGLERHYALELVRPGEVRLVKWLEGERVLAVGSAAWEWTREVNLQLVVRGPRVIGRVDWHIVFDFVDNDRPLLTGGVGLAVAEGRLTSGPLTIEPA